MNISNVNATPASSETYAEVLEALGKVPEIVEQVSNLLRTPENNLIVYNSMEKMLNCRKNINSKLRYYHWQTMPYNMSDFHRRYPAFKMKDGTTAKKKIDDIDTHREYYMSVTVAEIQGIPIALHFKLSFYVTPDIDIEMYALNIIRRVYLVTSYFADNPRIRRLAEIYRSEEKAIPLHLYLYDHDRVAPAQNHNVQELNRNHEAHCFSGFTNMSGIEDEVDPSLYIVCTRIQEMKQLLTHELLHLFHLDRVDDDSINNIFQDYVSGFDYRECIAAANTTILHAMISAIDLDIHHAVYTFWLCYLLEVFYSIYHTCKILCPQNFPEYGDYFGPTGNPRKYTQMAHYYEYTILRSFILLHPCYFRAMARGNLFVFQVEDIAKLVSIFKDCAGNMYENKNALIMQIYSRLYSIFADIIKNKSKVNMGYFCLDYYLS